MFENRSKYSEVIGRKSNDVLVVKPKKVQESFVTKTESQERVNRKKK